MGQASGASRASGASATSGASGSPQISPLCSPNHKSASNRAVREADLGDPWPATSLPQNGQGGEGGGWGGLPTCSTCSHLPHLPLAPFAPPCPMFNGAVWPRHKSASKTAWFGSGLWLGQGLLPLAVKAMATTSLPQITAVKAMRQPGQVRQMGQVR